MPFVSEVLVHVSAWATVRAAPPNPGAGQAPPAIAAKVDSVVSLVAWLAVAACVAGILVVAIRMALLHRRGELGDHMGGLGAVAGACVLIGTCSGLVDYFI